MQAWGVTTATNPSFQLAIYRRPDHPWEDFSEELVASGVWEADETRLMEALLEDACISNRGLMLDIGAFVGYYTMLVASKGCRVHAWEGHPQNARMVELGIAMNGMYSRVTLHHAICSNHNRPMIFAGSGMDGHVGSSYANTDNKLRQMELTQQHRQQKEHGTLVQPLGVDTVVSENVQLMKVDVEGYEPHVFASARKLIVNRQVKYILFEYNMWRAMTLADGVALVMTFIRHQYKVYQVPTMGCGFIEFKGAQQVAKMSEQLQQDAYACGKYSIYLLATRDGLTPGIVSAAGGKNVTEFVRRR